METSNQLQESHQTTATDLFAPEIAFGPKGGTAMAPPPFQVQAGQATHAVQRKVFIDGESYTHASRKINGLFESVAYELEEKGYKSYGVKSRLKKFIAQYRDEDKDLGDFDQFWGQFFPWLKQEKRFVKGKDQYGNRKTTAVLKKFSIKGMNRPKWPEKLKKQKEYQDGDNIRHVIRNATLKKALQIQNGLLIDESVDDKWKYWAKMAIALGVNFDKKFTIDQVVPLIYKQLYLNSDNLFSGHGPTNQVIGLVADTVKDFGETLIGLEDQELNVKMMFRQVENRIVKTVDQKRKMIKGSNKEIGEILYGILFPIMGDCADALLEDVRTQKGSEDENTRSLSEPEEMVDSETEEDEDMISVNKGEKMTDSGSEDEFTKGDEDSAPADVIGDLIADIGLNLGFDLIDGRSEEDQQNIGKRQARLLKAECALQKFIGSKGQSGDLVSIFKGFLDVQD